MEKVLLKIGGCLITDKSASTPSLNKNNIDRICDEISFALSNKNIKLILVHGAGSFGHPIVKATGIDSGINDEAQLRAFALTQSLQNQLNVFICNTLINKNVPAIPVQASASAVMKQKVLTDMSINAIEGFLDLGLVPVLYGVPAYDKKQGCSILSGDQIVCYLAKRLGIKRIIFATDVDGIFDSDPNKNENAKLIRVINKKNITNIIKNISKSSYTDVTGGMLGKIRELMKIKNIRCNIINGNKKGNIKRVLLGENFGTRIIL